MSSGMESTYRYWRRNAAKQIKEIKRLARAKQCREAWSLRKDLLRESVPSLVSWSSFGNLAGYMGRYCPVPKGRGKK
jgi:hypothetical protein